MLQSQLVPAEEGESKRLLVVLHGLGDSMEGYRWLPSALGLKWLNILLVNAPESYYGGYSWYDFAGDPGPGVERSRKLLFELLDEQNKRGFLPGKTVLFGFSQGCLMAVEVGGRYPHVLGGLVGVSGYVHQAEKLVKELSAVAKEQRFLLTHGTLDTMIPVKEVRPQVDHLKQSGLRIEWREFEKDHTIDPEIELPMIRQFIEQCLPPDAGE